MATSNKHGDEHSASGSFSELSIGRAAPSVKDVMDWGRLGVWNNRAELRVKSYENLNSARLSPETGSPLRSDMYRSDRRNTYGPADEAAWNCWRGPAAAVTNVQDADVGNNVLTLPVMSGVSGEVISSLLVLYTGGTIGMRTKNGAYEPEPNYLVNELRKLPILHDQSYADAHLNSEYYRDTLVMPVSKDGLRVLYEIREYDPILDSSNMTHDHYVRLASDIEENYTRYDGFIILHGTDTMSYSASALSFMLENLGKPIIFTGSQIPIFEPRSDGRHNFIGALILASQFNVPEVSIFFDNVLLRGNRSTKADNGAFDAFASPNMTPLATVGVAIKGLKKFSVHTRMCRNVGVLRLFPGITEMTVRAFLQPPMEGVVMETYGQGNGPTARADIMAALREASDRGVLIVNITQCSRGVVSAMYAAGKELQDIGVIAGSDMTVEAALMKLSYIIGKGEWSLHEKRKKIGENLRGEMSALAQDSRKMMQFSLIETLAETMRLSTSEEIQLLREAVFPYLLCAASREGSIEALERLRQAGAHFNMCDYDGRTALHVACCEGHAHVVQYLLDLGAPVHVRDRYGYMPLDDAVRFRHVRIIRLLRDTGAHIMIAPARLAMTICNVVVSEDAYALEYWGEAGADFWKLADDNGRTPLHVAADHGLIEHVRVLLSLGADPRRADAAGHTPLDVALLRKNSKIATLLQTGSRAAAKLS